MTDSSDLDDGAVESPETFEEALAAIFEDADDYEEGE